MFITKFIRLSLVRNVGLHRRLCSSSSNLYETKIKKYLSKKDVNNLPDQLKTLTNLYEKSKDDMKLLNDEIINNENDKELLTLMETEKIEMNEKQNKLIEKILDEILEYEKSNDELGIQKSASVLFEITPGVGGREAMLFANEISFLYSNYFSEKKWTVSDLDTDESNGLLRRYHATVDGFDVWDHLRFEAGVHRVQRVPATEVRGRIHTSTITIACIPMTNDSKIEINEKDIKIQTKTASGAGGQHVNKTESAIRITHIPTGIVVESQEDRSQIKNREIAMKKLKKILTDQHVKESFEKMLKTRKSQVGQANRNEKIRTYNFKDDRVTDHRLSALGGSLDEKVESQYDLDGFFKNPSRLDVFIENLKKVEKQQEIERIFLTL